MDDLIGKKIFALSVDTYKTSLAFETPDEIIVYFVEGGCCSSSWFNDVLGVDALLGHTVSQVEEVSMDDLPEEGEYGDVVQLYGIKLTTDRGIAEIIFRNASNGYYGGWCERSSSTDTSGFRPITQDWSADGEG